MDLEKDFDEMINVIRKERDKLTKVLKSLDKDDIGDYRMYLNDFKSVVLPMIQGITDRIISWVKTSNMDDLATLKDLVSDEGMTNGRFLNLIKKYGGNYWNNRFLYHVAFLNDFNADGLCQPIDCQYTLLLGLYNRIYYLSDLKEISDDSLKRFEKLFYGMF